MSRPELVGDDTPSYSACQTTLAAQRAELKGLAQAIAFCRHSDQLRLGTTSLLGQLSKTGHFTQVPAQGQMSVMEIYRQLPIKSGSGLL
jgi:hypothetical protein